MSAVFSIFRLVLHRTLVVAIVSLSSIGCSHFSHQDSGDADSVVPRKTVAPFSAARANGKLPDGWQPYVLRRDRRQTQYSSAYVDNRNVLRALADRASAAVICPVTISPTESPWLTWQWKVDRLVEGANISKDDFDDSATRVFLAFDGDPHKLPSADIAFFDMVKFFTGKDLPYATLSYVWDPILPVDTVVSYSHSSRIKYIVVESGSERLGQWTSYRRNIVDDYRRAFGEAPVTVISVGVMNDTDDLGQKAESFFGDIALQASPALNIGTDVAQSPQSLLKNKPNEN